MKIHLPQVDAARLRDAMRDLDEQTQRSALDGIAAMAKVMRAKFYEGTIFMTDAKQPLSGEWEPVEIIRKDAPDVKFEGKLLGAASSADSTRQTGRNKNRWTDLELWELKSGKWVATAIACSDVAGEIDYGRVHVIDGNDAPAQQRAAMEFWGHSWLGKQIAKDLGWDVAEQLS